MKATVYFKDHETNTMVRTAEVRIPEGMATEEALEYCYRWTNNINGSWSRDDIPNNPDFNENVTFVGKLPVYNGKVYGERSMMMGDAIFMDGEKYEVDFCGFKQVA